MAKILFSDDYEPIFEDSKDIAYKMGVELKCVTNWEDAQTELTNNWDSYDGLILDGKGKLNEAATGSNVLHMHRAINWLNQQYAKGYLMPTVIYTAHTGFASENLENQIDMQQPFILDVYNKNITIDKVIKLIINYGANLPETRLKLQYVDIFKLFDDKRLPQSMNQTMLEILSSLSSFTVDKTDYNKIRDIIEAMLKMANNIDKSFIPDILLNPIQNGRPNLGLSEIYLTGRDVLDPASRGTILIAKTPTPIIKDHVARIYSSIVNCCQIFSHNTLQKHYHYAYKSTVFGLLEVLKWYRDYLTSKYKI